MTKVTAKDFGPIIEGTVGLRPLTIFVGPSNAGKSYMAMLVYSLMQSLEEFTGNLFGPVARYDHLRPFRLTRHRFFLGLDEGLGINDAVNNILHDWVSNIEVRSSRALEISFSDLPAEVQHLINRSLKRSLETIQESFNRELERCHGIINDIQSRREGAKCLQFRLEQNDPFLRLIFDIENGSNLKITDKKWDVSQANLAINANLVRMVQAEPPRLSTPRKEIRDLRYNELLDSLAEATSASLFKDFPRNCYYLPAARSGIAQGHKAIASILVRQSSFAGIRPFEIPTLSGIITDFMGHILTMERARGFDATSDFEEMESVVDFLEHEVVRGTIDIERSGDITYPEITYTPFIGQPEVGKLPFHRTSSMVSELAPVILFLKYLVGPEDLLILEEPESHLHPASQRQMARGIARLVNAGIRVIITTHSDYFIAQINNLLKLSDASRQKRAREGLDSVDCLKPDDIAAYHFKLDSMLGGSFVQEMPILPGFGIEEKEFAAVSEALYEQTISLQATRSR